MKHEKYRRWDIPLEAVTKLLMDMEKNRNLCHKDSINNAMLKKKPENHSSMV